MDGEMSQKSTKIPEPTFVSTRRFPLTQMATIRPSGSHPFPLGGPSVNAAYRRLVAGVLDTSISQINPANQRDD